MRFYLIVVLSFCAPAFYGQVADAFDDGNFSSSPEWQGDTSHFIVNSSKQLQLKSSGTDTSVLWVSGINSDSTVWEIWTKLSFAPSDNNNLKIYLASDNTNFTGTLNGYYLRMGENGADDSIDLWRQDGVTHTRIIDGKNGHCAKSTNTIRLKITKSNAGYWQLYADTLGGFDFIPEGSIVDSTHKSQAMVGLYCKYTSSNSQKFYFDDIKTGPWIADKTAPLLLKCETAGNTGLTLFFSETIDQSHAASISKYLLNSSFYPVSASRNLSNTTQADLIFNEPFKEGLFNIIRVLSMKDTEGNESSFLTDSFYIYTPQPKDIVINEILPDPRTGSVDFVELLNISDKRIRLNDLFLASFDTISTVIKETGLLPDSSGYLLPGEYIVVSENGASVRNEYHSPGPGVFTDIPELPPMNIAGGGIALCRKDSTFIDMVIYNETMHFPLLSQTKGVSLEKINPRKPGSAKENWHSAAETAGYATPGYKNSQYFENSTSGTFSLSSSIFSPDNDGYEDLLNIGFVLPGPGYIANIGIYDTEGRLIRNLERSLLCGISGNTTWNGITDHNERAEVGAYIILFEAFNEEGNSIKHKKACFLTVKF